jgi:hypothetical protein
MALMATKPPENDGADLPPEEALGTLPRFACALVGVAGLGGGATATFITKNAFGSGVMLIIGAFFTFVGATGIPVTSLKIAGSEVVFARVFRRVLKSANPDVREEVAEAVLESDLPPRSPIRQQAQEVKRAYQYTAEVMEALRRVAPTGSVVGEIGNQDLRLDAKVSIGDKTIGVEVKDIRNSFAMMDQAISQALYTITAGYGKDLDGFLVVSNNVEQRHLLDASREADDLRRERFQSHTPDASWLGGNPVRYCHPRRADEGRTEPAAVPSHTPSSHSRRWHAYH